MAYSASTLLAAASTVKHNLNQQNWQDMFSLDNAFLTVLSVVLGIVILFVGNYVGIWVHDLVQRWIAHTRSSHMTLQTSMDKSLSQRYRHQQQQNGVVSKYSNAGNGSLASSVIGKVAYAAVMLGAATIVLFVVGVRIASIVAIITTAMLVLGLSLQGTLNDLISGVLMAFFGTFDIGDVVQTDNFEGYVVDLRMINTIVEDIGTRALVSLPNSKLQNSVVKNLSRHRFHYFLFNIKVSNDSLPSSLCKKGSSSSSSPAGQSTTQACHQDWNLLTHKVAHSLSDQKKHPYVMLSDSKSGSSGSSSGSNAGANTRQVKVLVGIGPMDNDGTYITVQVPLVTGPDLMANRGALQMDARNVLARHGVQMSDHDYSYLLSSSRAAVGSAETPNGAHRGSRGRRTKSSSSNESSGSSGSGNAAILKPRSLATVSTSSNSSSNPSSSATFRP